MNDTTAVEIRFAEPEQIDLILEFIKKLATYEKRAKEIEATTELLEQYLFGEQPLAEVIFAYRDDKPIGFALFLPIFSTFQGKPGLYIEDIYVEPELRGQGIGSRILAFLATLVEQRGYNRLEWSVLTWNEKAIQFYGKHGAKLKNEWVHYHLTGDSLRKLADLC